MVLAYVFCKKRYSVMVRISLLCCFLINTMKKFASEKNLSLLLIIVKPLCQADKFHKTVFASLNSSVHLVERKS